MSIAGPAAAALGLLLAAATFTLGTSTGFAVGSLMFFAGMGTTVIGIPVLITGSSRVNTINNFKNSNAVTLELVLCSFINYQAQNHQTGVTLRIRF